MKQVFQSLGSGKIDVIDVPAPACGSNQILIKTSASLISAGTERMLLDFGKASLIGKIKQQPEKVKQVFEKVKTDGLFTTLEAIKSKLDQPITLGYCNVGEIIDFGRGVTGYSIGDRVLSNGAHAEIICVPKNLCVKIPTNLSDESAVFAVLGAIGLQGIRLAQPTLGETVVVLGLGLIGLLTIQLLRAQGCRVLGADFDQHKLALARQFGAETVDLTQGEDLVDRAVNFSRGRGVDVVLITASTQSNDPVRQAALMCRKRGRIVLVGVTGLNLSRDDFYKKELSFQVSCSYGPGRYDPEYESKGNDYPFGFVRWTEQRNMEAVLDMMSEGKIDVSPLISHSFDIAMAAQAYQKLDEDRNGLGFIISYPSSNKIENKVLLDKNIDIVTPTGNRPVLAFVGAGNYAGRVLIPAFKKTNSLFHTIVSGQGASAVIHGSKNGFKFASTSYDEVLHDSNINTVIITTRHNLHAEQIIKALNAGKHVFVEKPMVISEGELELVKETYQKTVRQFPVQKLMVGYNRRFAPQIKKIKELLDSVKSPKYLTMSINAGFIPADHWTQDQDIGGGRLIGEGCHFIDLLRFLVGEKITDANVLGMSPENNSLPKNENFIVTLKFADGSVGSVQYYANGNKEVSKERLEVSTAGRILQLDNFRKLQGYGWPGFRKMSLWKQDKGQASLAQAWTQAIEGGIESPICFEEIVEVMQICLKLSAQLNLN